MTSTNEKKVRKLVPRFRRKNLNENVVDFDDAEAEALIHQDLKSVYKWTTDFEENANASSNIDQLETTNSKQNLSFTDQFNQEYFIDLENTSQSKINIFFHSNENNLVQYDHQGEDHQHPQLFLSESTLQKQQWTMDHQDSFRLNLIDPNQQLSNYDFDQKDPEEILQFLTEKFHEIRFTIQLSHEDEEINLFIGDQENIQSIHFDCSNPSKDLILSLPQQLNNAQWIEGLFHLTFSLNDQQQSKQIYSPNNSIAEKLDLENVENLLWSIDFLKENLIKSYLINLIEETSPINYSILE